MNICRNMNNILYIRYVKNEKHMNMCTYMNYMAVIGMWIYENIWNQEDMNTCRSINKREIMKDMPFMEIMIY